MVRQTDADDARTEDEFKDAADLSDDEAKALAWEAADYIRERFDDGDEYVRTQMREFDTVTSARKVVESARFFGWEGSDE